MNLKVSWQSAKLTRQMDGQEPIKIFAESPDPFFMTSVDAALSLSTGKEHPTTVTLSEGGHTMTLQRVP